MMFYNVTRTIRLSSGAGAPTLKVEPSAIPTRRNRCECRDFPESLTHVCVVLARSPKEAANLALIRHPSQH